MNNIGFLGMGHYVPPKILSNDELEETCGVKATTIFEKLGIRERRISGASESPSDLAVEASVMALEAAACTSDEIDLIICCTFTGDYLYPALACKLHQLLRCKNAGAYDVVANCTGFQVGLNLAAGQFKLNSTAHRRILVCGVALQSRFINFSDPDTAPYFGDGAGAALLGAVPPGYGIIHSLVWTDSTAYDSVRMRAGGANFPPATLATVRGKELYYEMNGLEVWKQVVRNLPKVMRTTLDQASLAYSDIDFFIFHQANKNLIEYLIKKIGRSMCDTHLTLDRFGNTADASIPITLSEAQRQGRIKRGDHVMIAGIGAGFTFGVTIARWY